MNRPIRRTPVAAARRAPLVLAALAAVLAAQDPAGRAGLQPPGVLNGMEPDAGDLDLRTTPIVRAVQRGADSVVSIYIYHGERLLGGGQGEAIDGQGSGVIVDESGFVITNWHVIAPVAADRTRYAAKARLKSGDTYDADLVSSSPEHDLALLQLHLPGGRRVKPVVASDSDTLMVGETVIAIGNPQGHANSVTVGVLSQLGRSITVRAPDGRPRRYEGLLQTDAAINQGNSGGALLDITGKLIGINNAMAVGVENIGFAIPVNTVKKVFEDVLLASDNLADVWLGVKVKDEGGTARVAELVPFSPAARSGLQLGDRIVAVAGSDVRSAVDYARSTLRARAGQPVDLVVERDGRRVTLQPVPLSNTEFELIRRCGVEFDVVTRDGDEELLKTASIKFYEDLGRRPTWLPCVLRVRRVHPDGPADDVGFQAGDVLYGVRVFSGWRGTQHHFFRALTDFADLARGYEDNELDVLVLRGDSELRGKLFVRRL